MRKLILTSAVLAVMAGSAALAQTGAPPANGTNPNGVSAEKGPAAGAPVGHRQPRAGDVPSEKNLSSPNDAVNREDAALDRKIKSICRGC